MTSTTSSTLRRPSVFDGVAMLASALCLVHCLALPALILALPALAAYLALPEAFHEIALAVALPSSLVALVAGYRRHRQSRAALIVVPGLLLLVLGAFAAPSETTETVLTVIGALLVAGGHVHNGRMLAATVAAR